MTAHLQKHFDEVFLQLQKTGMLLMSDASLPNVSAIVAEKKVQGSWWSHQKAHDIFGVCERLDDHPDVLIVKLISEKVTFVHRELWVHVYSIGVAREEWQLKDLSPKAKKLLALVDSEGLLQTNKLSKDFGPKPGEAVRELERRLLLHTNQIHTESGAHAKVIETWPTWAKRAGFKARAKGAEVSRKFLEKRLTEMNEEFNGAGHLPWTARVS